ncbi:leucyl/phenylalanyl-tRNA--protein transferase [Tistrella mobilis]|uniref:leucyl/phenylalanyl-tRNA--protein transferase n=1 Tax=Tistrella mobilis TaxID=171437 RepID=UPI0031F5F7A3
MHLTPDLLLRAYVCGIFPMAESGDKPELYWVDPDRRGVLPLDGFHLPRKLRKTIRRQPFTVTVDADFEGVMCGCAAPAPGRERTWINDEILALYTELHQMGHAHSIEVREGAELVGGLYGVSLGAAFFGESMFSRRTDASKVALVHLVARLKRGGYRLLDTQFVTDHLTRFGAIEIPRGVYQDRLRNALGIRASFIPEPFGFGAGTPDQVLAAIDGPVAQPRRRRPRDPMDDADAVVLEV